VSCSVREPIVDFDGAGVSPMSDERIAFSAATEVDRGDWGRTWNMALETGGVVVAKKVGIELNVQAVARPGLSDAV
jgi:polyisoprenoid-binding protein YceI